MRIKFQTILSVGLLATASANAQSVLFNQPFFARVGGNLSDSSPYSCYDDFTLANGGIVNQVNWSGLDSFSNVTAFTISFWSDNGGLPGSLLASDSISGNAGETPTGQFDGSGNQIFNYSANLAVPFSAVPGTEYLLSIVGNGHYAWVVSDVGDFGVLQYATGGIYTPIEHDQGLAFTLEGATVPEPSMIALGLCGASVFLFRRFLK